MLMTWKTRQFGLKGPPRLNQKKMNVGCKDPVARGTKHRQSRHLPPKRPAEELRTWSKERDNTAERL